MTLLLAITVCGVVLTAFAMLAFGVVSLVEAMICYGNAKPDDTHLLADVVAVDGEIVAWLERREQKKPQRNPTNAPEHRTA
jgi:hypothetical protein